MLDFASDGKALFELLDDCAADELRVQRHLRDTRIPGIQETRFKPFQINKWDSHGVFSAVNADGRQQGAL
jgi:hypothetical protein